MISLGAVAAMAVYAVVFTNDRAKLNAQLDGALNRSVQEIKPSLDLRIRPEGMPVHQMPESIPPAPKYQRADVEIIRVRFDTIGSVFFRDSATAGRLYRELGGWIADDVPVKKTESLHPKGMQKILAGAVPDPQEPGTYLLREDLKTGMTEQDLLTVVLTSELRGDKG